MFQKSIHIRLTFQKKITRLTTQKPTFVSILRPYKHIILVANSHCPWGNKMGETDLCTTRSKKLCRWVSPSTSDDRVQRSSSQQRARRARDAVVSSGRATHWQSFSEQIPACHQAIGVVLLIAPRVATDCVRYRILMIEQPLSSRLHTIACASERRIWWQFHTHSESPG